MNNYCIYCNESDIKNNNVYKKVFDIELGHGWVCKECYENNTTFTLKEIKEIIKNNLPNRCVYSTCKRLGEICSECVLAENNLLISKFGV